MKHENHITHRYYIQGVLCLDSPAIIGSGENELADTQLVRDWDGNVIIPGTTLAGNIRHALKEAATDIGEKLIKTCFGSSDDTSGHSLLSFFDGTNAEDCKVTTEIRDGVKIDSITKTVELTSKYDYETICTGSSFTFRMEAVSRESTDAESVEKIISAIIRLLEQGQVRIGAKTSRGFGKIRLEEKQLCKLVMDQEEDRQAWIDFFWSELGNIATNTPLAEDNDQTYFQEAQSFTCSTTFNIPDSLIIKSSSPDPEDVDFVSLTSSGQPIISGTSWCGAIRHALENVGRELGKKEKMEELLKHTFGWVSSTHDTTQQALPSRIFIDESPIENASMIPYTRNKIDRFTGGVVKGALFDEKSVYGGTVTLNCEIKNPEDYEKGMLILAITELKNGIQTVGGCSNIGRGRLRPAGENGDSFLPSEEEQKFLNALAIKLNEQTEDNSDKRNGKEAE